MASYEDVLAYKALQDEQKRLTAPQAAGLGAAVGLLAGFSQRGKFGQRMAGGASQAIIGGGLGLGIQQIALAESGAARSLATLQAKEVAGQPLNQSDLKQLEDALADAYNSQSGIS